MVQVLAVGKGGATLVHSPRGKTLLVDTSGDASILRALGETLPFWKRSIDAVILTSKKANSIGGLPDVTSRYHVSKVIHFGAPESTPYGARLTFDIDTFITVTAPGIFTISYGTTSFNISSSTTPGLYLSNGQILTKPY